MHGTPVEGVCVICTLIQAQVCAYLREGVYWGRWCSGRVCSNVIQIY